MPIFEGLPTGDQPYQLLGYSTDMGVGADRRMTFPTQGRYLYVAEIAGTQPLYAILDTAPNRPIRLTEGMVFNLEFNQVTIFQSDQAGVGVGFGYASLLATEAILYASWTPINRVPERDYGLKRGFWCGQQLVTAGVAGTAIPFFQDLMPLGGAVLYSFGKRGAILYIANEDSVNLIRVAYSVLGQALVIKGGAPVGVGFGFPIFPNTVQAFPLGQRMVSQTGALITAYEGMIVTADAASVRYSYLISAREADQTDLHNRGSLIPL